MESENEKLLYHPLQLDSDKANVHNVLPKFLESDGEFEVETGH